MRLNRVRAVVGTVSAVVLLGAPAGAQGSGPPAPAAPAIAYTTYNGIRSIQLAQSETGGAREVASGTEPYFAWSPTGERIAFSAEDAALCRGCARLWVVDVADGVTLPLTGSGTAANPAWSPSGKLIAFDRCQSVTSTRCAIYVISPDGRGLRRVTPFDAESGPPVWSGNGRTIAFYGLLHPGIYVVGSDGHGLRRLTRKNDSDPVWSPDGAEIAFTRSTPTGLMNARDDIYVIHPSGRGLRRLTNAGTQNFDPDWSPDGHLIVYVGAGSYSGNSCGDEAVYEMSAGGTDRRQLTGMGLFESPLFSPNETSIAYLGIEPDPCPPAEPSRSLYVLPAGGGAPHMIAGPGIEAAGGIAWQPEP